MVGGIDAVDRQPAGRPDIADQLESAPVAGAGRRDGAVIARIDEFARRAAPPVGEREVERPALEPTTHFIAGRPGKGRRGVLRCDDSANGGRVGIGRTSCGARVWQYVWVSVVA